MKVARKKSKKRVMPTNQLLDMVLRELRNLRNDFALLLPSEGLDEYEHPDRVKRSHQKALKKYPPAA